MKTLKLNIYQKDLLIGTLLGDGNLKSETKGRTWCYRALHKEVHKEYLFFKYDLLNVICKSSPSFSFIFDKRTKKYYKWYYFNTIVHPCFNFYGNLFYTYDKKNKCMFKDVPSNIEKFLTPRAIAFWYMDDGALKWLGKSNAMRICTESFSKLGVERLQKALKTLYDIDMNLMRKTNKGIFVGYRLSINEEKSLKFSELIKPYLIDCMRYKVSNGLKGHL